MAECVPPPAPRPPGGDQRPAAVLYVAVIAPAEAQREWIPTRCHIEQAYIYECWCTVDQYGYVHCSTCEDVRVSYRVSQADVSSHQHQRADDDAFYMDDDDGGYTSVTVTLSLSGRSFYGGQRVSCRVNPADLTDVRLAWSYPTLTIAIFGTLAFLPACCVLGVLADSLCRRVRSRRLGGSTYGAVDDECHDRNSAARVGRVALFGPPGVGKRTMLATAGQQGLPTHDLVVAGRNYAERLAQARALFASSGGADPGVRLFGAADLRVEDFPRDVELVLVLPPLDVYQRRFRACCEVRPEERAQDGTGLWHDFDRSAHRFDRVLRRDLTPVQAVDWVVGPYGAVV